MTYKFNLFFIKSFFAQCNLRAPHSPRGEFQTPRESVAGPPKTLLCQTEFFSPLEFGRDSHLFCSYIIDVCSHAIQYKFRQVKV